MLILFYQALAASQCFFESKRNFGLSLRTQNIQSKTWLYILLSSQMQLTLAQEGKNSF